MVVQFMLGDGSRVVLPVAAGPALRLLAFGRPLWVVCSGPRAGFCAWGPVVEGEAAEAPPELAAVHVAALSDVGLVGCGRISKQAGGWAGPVCSGLVGPNRPAGGRGGVNMWSGFWRWLGLDWPLGGRPVGLWNGRRVVGVRLTLAVSWDWRWRPVVGLNCGAFHWGCVRSWWEWDFDWFEVKGASDDPA